MLTWISKDASDSDVEMIMGSNVRRTKKNSERRRNGKEKFKILGLKNRNEDL